MSEKLNSRIFTFGNQKAFAKLSGDYNPLHLDKLLSRRLLFGSSVVHGIHLLLWSLDSWLGQKKEKVNLEKIKVSFTKPISVEEEVILYLVKEQDNQVIMELKCGGLITTKIQFGWQKLEEENVDDINFDFPKKSQSRVVLAEEIESQSGNLNLYLNRHSSSNMFPNLSDYFSQLQTSLFLSSTRLVGTKCPGLYSIYTELSLSFGIANKCKKLEYEVKRFNKRFGMISMNISAPSAEGHIQALIRPKERKQSTFLEIKEKVKKDEFKHQSALIIGGSRGLGEVTAKILAAGSADVKLTYHQGEKDAKIIVKEIRANDAIADCIQYDALSPNVDSFQNKLKNWRPTHLYYFATPFIFNGRKGTFSFENFIRFCDYYVSGFKKIIDILEPSELKNIFYPSSVAIKELPPDMSEYVAAKLAGETFCAFHEKNYNGVTIYRPRLPRLDTDQTVSILPVNNEDPVNTQLEHLRKFQEISTQMP